MSKIRPNISRPSIDGLFDKACFVIKRYWWIILLCLVFIGGPSTGLVLWFESAPNIAIVAYTIIAFLMLICVVVAALFAYDQLNVLKQQIVEMEKQRKSAFLWELRKAFSSDKMYDALIAIFKRNRLLDGAWVQSPDNDKARRRVVHFLDTLGALVINGGITIKVLKSWFSDTPVNAWNEVKKFEIEKEMEILQSINPSLNDNELHKQAEARVDDSPAAELVRMWNADAGEAKADRVKLSGASNQGELSVSAISQFSVANIRPSLIAASTLVGNLLLAISAPISPGSFPSIGVFIMKIIVFLHGQKKMERLSTLVNDLKERAQYAREQGTLIDFNNSQNLENLFWKIEDFIEARDERKADLLRRVAICGLIKTDVAESQERDFRYAIRLLEIEDIELLKNVVELTKQSRPVIGEDGTIPTLIDPEIILRTEMERMVYFNHFRIARIVSTGLVISETRWDGLVFRVTDSGKSFIDYLKRIDFSSLLENWPLADFCS